jgi:hypothetical protein
MKPSTYIELYKAVEEKQIVSGKRTDKTFRLFIATNGNLCYFKKNSSKNGYRLSEEQFSTIETFQGEKIITEENKKKTQYNVIAKFRKMAEGANFSNSFITDCKKLPTYADWIKDGAKGLYELGITTGNKIEGRVISIKRIEKQYPDYAERLRDAIKNHTEGIICTCTPFAGYEMSLSTAKTATDEFIGYLSLEFKGCLNGYYYLLINDDNFIGYDVD